MCRLVAHLGPPVTLVALLVDPPQGLALLAWASLVYLWHDFRHVPLSPRRVALVAGLLGGAAALGVATFASAMRRGVRALESMA